MLFISFLMFSQQEDGTPPVLNWITVTPETVANGETITVQINVTDDLSGISHVGAYLGNPNDALYENLNGYFSYIGDDTYEATVTINEWAISGEWFISSLYLVDNAGNSNEPDTAEYFTVNSTTPDADAPTINSITITPDTVNNGDEITIQINVTDEVSGVAHVGAYLGNPNNALYENLNGVFTYIGDNIYEVTVSINDWAISGEWFVSSLYVVDNAGNSIEPDTIEYFTVNSTTPDADAPTLNWITITPDEVNNGDTITVQINVTDEVSGVSHVGAYLGSPNDVLYENLNGYFSYIGDDTYEATVSINEWAISGEWFISTLYLVDFAGNSNEPDTIEYFTVINTTLSTDDAEFLLTDKISIYPNPTADKVFIKAEIKDDIEEMSLYDFSGRKILTNKDNFDIIDISTYKSGVYFLQLKTNQGALAKQVVKQ